MGNGKVCWELLLTQSQWIESWRRSNPPERDRGFATTYAVGMLRIERRLQEIDDEECMEPTLLQRV